MVSLPAVRAFALPPVMVLLAAAMLSAPAQACKWKPGPFVEALGRLAAQCGGHPLCGQILAPKPEPSDELCGSGLRLQGALGQVRRGEILLILGEAHDNATHHRLQATALGEIAAAEGGTDRPAAVLEQVSADQLEVPQSFATVAEMKHKLAWKKSGWVKYDYDALLGAIVASELTVHAGDPPREMIRKLAKSGPETLPAEDRERLKLDVPLDAGSAAASDAEIEGSHCGKLPKEAIPRMAYAQRYRDAHLAGATLKAAAASGAAILITGNTHARKDRGVPWYIRQRAPEKKIVSVQMIEVEDGKTDPEAYVERGPDGEPVADFLIFTPRADRPDPCLAFRDKSVPKAQ